MAGVLLFPDAALRRHPSLASASRAGVSRRTENRTRVENRPFSAMTPCSLGIPCSRDGPAPRHRPRRRTRGVPRGAARIASPQPRVVPDAVRQRYYLLTFSKHLALD